MGKRALVNPVRLAIIGMGGFASRHHVVVQALEESGEARLICTCDPRPEAFAAKLEEWRQEARGFRVFNDYRAMLDECRGELDMVVISTPIPLHAEMHRYCVDLGLPVYLEKPPTLDPAELEAMIELDQRQKFRTHIPFNFTIEQPRLALKERLLAGEFGALREVHFFGIAPRASSYYARAGWSGRLLLNGALILDSCLGNAMAHKVHDALFWAGTDRLFSWAAPEEVEAELYRAHHIEGADTIFCRARTGRGVDLRLFFTHAFAGRAAAEETLVCERAVLDYSSAGGATIRWRDGKVEEIDPDVRELVPEHHRWYYAYLHGEKNRPATMLEDSRPFVHLNALVYLSGGRILSIPDEYVEVLSAAPQTGEFRRVHDLDQIAQRFLRENMFPSRQGLHWAKESSMIARPKDLPRLREVVEAMV